MEEGMEEKAAARRRPLAATLVYRFVLGDTTRLLCNKSIHIRTTLATELGSGRSQSNPAQLPIHLTQLADLIFPTGVHKRRRLRPRRWPLSRQLSL